MQREKAGKGHPSVPAADSSAFGNDDSAVQPAHSAASSIITAECEQAAGKNWRDRRCDSRLRQTALR